MNAIIRTIQFIFLLGNLKVLYSLPVGTEVFQGSLQSEIVGNQLNLRVSDNSILNHQSFDIGLNETVRFIQDSQDSRVLNRVLTNNPSQILGNLLSNGSVYLINPAGIIFGDQAVVEVGKFYAIAGSMSNNDFSNEIDRFYSLVGEIENKGKISAKEITMVGSMISNSGRLSSLSGKVILGVGNTLQVENREDGDFVMVNQPVPHSNLFLGDLASQAILQTGIVEATKVLLHGNKIEQTGILKSTTVQAGEISSLSGKFDSVKLEINSNKFNSDVNIESSSSLSSLQLDGSYNSIQVSSSQSLEISSLSDSSFQVQDMDVRVMDGDLTISNNITPLYLDQKSSILLAAENEILTTESLSSYNHDYQIFYGRNFDAASHLSDDLTLGASVYLNAESLRISDLSVNLPPRIIRKLAVDNPAFDGFEGILSKEGIGNTLSNNTRSLNDLSLLENTLSLPALLPVQAISSVSQTENLSLPGLVENFDSSLVGSFGLQTNNLSDSQISLLSDYGLFNGYKYFLKAPSEIELAFLEYSERGGGRIVYGDDFSLLEPSSRTNQSGFSQSEFSEQEDSVRNIEIVAAAQLKNSLLNDNNSESSNEEVDKIISSNLGQASKANNFTLNSVTPYSPVGRGVPSKMAAKILENALSNEMENKLETYLDD